MEPSFYTPEQARARAAKTVRAGKILLANELMELKSQEPTDKCVK